MTRLTVSKFMADMDLTKREKILALLCCVFFFLVLLSNKPLASNVFQFQGKLKNPITDELTLALEKASMPNKTVIITTVNIAWMKPGGIFELFLKSFETGEGTKPLLKNLLVVAHDDKAFNACTQIHPHCYRLPGVDFSGASSYNSGHYVEITRSKILLLTNVLRRGYHFIFSDSDILWLRNPFERLSRDADFEMSCDRYSGDPYSMSNMVNTGFMFFRCNKRTVEMMEVWNNASEAKPSIDDQAVFYHIKMSENITRLGLRPRFLDTKYFSGFCQSGNDLNVVCIMHGNCCKGFEAKIHDLNEAFQDWTSFKSGGLNKRNVHWRARDACRNSWH